MTVPTLLFHRIYDRIACNTNADRVRRLNALPTLQVSPHARVHVPLHRRPAPLVVVIVVIAATRRPPSAEPHHHTMTPSPALSPAPPALYMPHLDGLRALAMLGVLLFHFDVPLFRGGFVGVDIFFTLSGFLITHTLLSRPAAAPGAPPAFSLRSFYRKRFFRLYPASLVVVAATLAAAHLCVRPIYHEAITHSALAALGVVANIYFHHNGEYFAATFEMRPLLHFWSLSVEEQFYMLWPPLILLCKHNPRRLVTLLSVILVSSLFMASTMFSRHATLVFYQLPTRAFQFAAGALVYVGLLYRGVISRWAQRYAYSTSTTKYYDHHKHISDRDDITSVAMTGIILLSFSLLPSRPHPIATLPVTIATCFLMAMPTAVICDVVFQLPVVIWLGKVSYAVYLVHWPLAILGSYALSGTSIPILPQPLFLFLSLYLGAKLHEHVEVPFRCKGGKNPSLRHRAALFSLLALTVMYAANGAANGGYRDRFPEDGKSGWPLGVQPIMYWDICNDVSADFSPMDDNLVICRIGDVAKGSRGNVFFFGDSFTGHLTVGLHRIGLKRKEYYDVRFVNYCGFRTMWHSKTRSKSPNGFPCSDVVGAMWEHMRYIPNGSTVAVANWWGEPHNINYTFAELNDEVTQRGKRLAVVAEPPGMSTKYRGYFACADLSVLWLGKVWQQIRYGIGSALKSGRRCVERDLDFGLEPNAIFVEMQTAYRDIFRRAQASDERKVELVNVFAEMCVNETNKFRCRVPMSHREEGVGVGTNPVVHDLGYETDMVHLTSVGSYHVGRWLEQELEKCGVLDGGRAVSNGTVAVTATMIEASVNNESVAVHPR